MILHVTKAEYLHDYVLRIFFNDGMEGEVDFQNELYGEVFEPLKELSRFTDFTVDPDMHTIVWSNGADFAPEFLHERMKVLA